MLPTSLPYQVSVHRQEELCYTITDTSLWFATLGSKYP